MWLMVFVGGLKKWLAISRLTWKQTASYKTHLLLSSLSGHIPLVAAYFLWSAIYQGNAGHLDLYYTNSEILRYIIFSYLLAHAISPFGIEWEISSDIFDGRISRYLLYPVSYIRFYLARLTGQKLLALSLRLPIIILFLTLLPLQIVMPDFTYLLLFLISAILAYFIYSLISIALSFSAFWLTDVTGIFYIGNHIITLLSGMLLPINLFPAAFHKIAKLLPFYYIIFLPMQIFAQRIPVDEAILAISVQAGWLIFLNVLCAFILRMGTKKYEAFGG